jgi:hypothetical protein
LRFGGGGGGGCGVPRPTPTELESGTGPVLSYRSKALPRQPRKKEKKKRPAKPVPGEATTERQEAKNPDGPSDCFHEPHSRLVSQRQNRIITVCLIEHPHTQLSTHTLSPTHNVCSLRIVCSLSLSLFLFYCFISCWFRRPLAAEYSPACDYRRASKCGGLSAHATPMLFPGSSLLCFVDISGAANLNQRQGPLGGGTRWVHTYHLPHRRAKRSGKKWNRQ